jgi:uncharacterized membrane protein YjgN (DUF898 family)
MSDTHVDSMFDPRQKGISGSKFTIAFVILLALGVIFGFLAAIRFQKTMSAFDDVRLKWPAAAASIDDQIQSIDKTLADLKDPLPGETLSGWTKAVTGFRQSSQYDRQVLQLDALLESWKAVRDAASSESEVLFPERTQAVNEFVEADSTLGKLQTDTLGRVCQAVFGLNLSDRVFQKL